MPLKIPMLFLIGSQSPPVGSAMNPLPVVEEHGAELASPLSVRVLRFYPEEKEATSLKKTRFVYEIETCHAVTGDVYRAHRRFREFKRLREGLLAECRDCHDCRHFVRQLSQAKLPPRGLVVVDADTYGTTRTLQLTHFLTDLVQLVARHARCCRRDGADVDRSVGLFLGLASLSEAEDVVDATHAALAPLRKTRQDRIDFRAASLADFRFTAADDALAKFRTRGYSMNV